MLLVAALAVIALVFSISGEAVRTVLSQQEFQIRQVEHMEAGQALSAGMEMLKAALKDDLAWNDCVGADGNCASADEYGFFPLAVPVSGIPKVKNYRLAGRNSRKSLFTSVYIKPESSSKLWALIEGRSGKQRVVLLLEVAKSGGYLDRVPLAYAGVSSQVHGGRICSYYWRGNKYVGVTRPSFSVYIDKNFYWSPEIVIPRRPAGPNKKDVKFFSDPESGTVRVIGYRTIDEIYSTGNISLENNAYVDLAYANGRVYTSGGASAGKVVENGKFVYPDFREELEDNRVTEYRSTTEECKKEVTLLPGRYGDLIIRRGCRLKLTSGEYTFRNILVKTSDAVFIDVDGGVTLNVKSFVDDGYHYWFWRFPGSVEFRFDSSDDYLIFKGEDLEIYSGSYFSCSDPSRCLIDVNQFNLERQAEFYGTVIARDKAYLGRNSLLVGNIFTEKLQSRYATICNVVDAAGHQIVGLGSDFYGIIIEDPSTMPFSPTLEVALKAVCRDVAECVKQIR